VEIERSDGVIGLHVTVQPGTPVGQYHLEIVGESLGGKRLTADATLEVLGVTVPKFASGKNPVVLLNGFQAICTSFDSTFAASSGTFGQLATLLQQSDDIPVAFFNNCSFGDIPIEQLAVALGSFINTLTYTDGTPVTQQVDLVAHSMGGLISRAYLTGLQQDGSLSPPDNPRVRKLIMIGTPNFGSFQATRVGYQAPEMVPGSAFLWYLSQWNQRRDDLRGVDALAIAGNAGIYYSVANGTHVDDGVVSLTSASLSSFGAPDERTRIVPYCHVPPGLVNNLVMDCFGAGGIANIDTPSHLTSQIVRSFLADTPAWTIVGHTPSTDTVLPPYGGVYFALLDEYGQYITDLSQVSWAGINLQNGGASGAIFYKELLAGTGAFQFVSQSRGTVGCGSLTPPVGQFFTYRCKYGPMASSVTPTLPGSSALIVQAASPITIHGSGWGQPCNFCNVQILGGYSLKVQSWTDQAITVTLEDVPTGLVPLMVNGSSGSDSINIFVVAQPSVNLGGVVNAANSVSGPVAPGSIAAVYGDFVVGVPQAAAGLPLPTSLAGVSLKTGNSVAFPLFYASNGQINVQIPWELAGQTQTSVTPTTSGQSGAPQTVALAAFSPGIFSVNGQGSGQGAIVDALTGRLVNSSNPAIAGSTYLTIYCTGLGPVSNQPASGSPSPGTSLALTRTTPTVTIGGVSAQVSFSGLAPGYVGLYQLNVLVPASVTPGNAVPVVLSIGGATSNIVAIAVAGGGLTLGGQSFSIKGPLTIAGTSVTLQLQAIGSSSYLIDLDDTLSPGSPVSFVVGFNATPTISGNTATFSGPVTSGLYQNQASIATVNSVTLTITFATSAPATGSAASGNLTFATSAGSVSGTFTGTLTFLGF